MDVRWTTVFIDRETERFDAARTFWSTVTATAVSATRGAHDEFSSFLPPVGDPFMRIQRVETGPGGSHLDLHVDDVRAGAAGALGLGAGAVADLGGIVVMRSPGGLPFCVVAHRGETMRPQPVGAAGERTLVDQICIDIAPDRFDAEYRFWSELSGWELSDGRERDFRVLARPAGMPLRFLLQRRGGDAGADAECHLDLACDDVDGTVARHVVLGASFVERHTWWTVMADPAGVRYCVTRRDPDSGLPAADV